ncbi:MAG TPA: carboxypeptidase regulatory-like domain-containing protein [Bryobacteraceae bacterium]|nr:carboxypeptidase regulatory-like domain-containing protein [Bryobacteraceae bacterium]
MLRNLLLLIAAMPFVAVAQDPTGVLEGQAADKSGSSLSKAAVSVKNAQTGFTQTQFTGDSGFYRFPALPVGEYSLTVEAPNFARFTQGPINIVVSQISRVDIQMELATLSGSVTITGDATQVDTATNILGKTVSGREVLDLPLNGRNFTQLGLLQTGVAPVSAGVLKIGGTLRDGQAYSVNGQRPESNNYLLDGSEINNRVDGGYALKIPVDSIMEFRILTHTAPPEFGGYSGSTTSVVMKGGGNAVHGTLYEFFRNDKLDTRNFFSRGVEPLKQNQFGGTAGAPIVKDKLFAFGYYEGFRNRQGFTQSAAVPTVAQKTGDYNGTGIILRNNAAGGTPYPDNRIPANLIHPLAGRIIQYYPNGNTSPSVHSETVVTENSNNQAGGRADWNRSENDRYFARYSWSSGHNVNPISVRGAPVPGFPTRDDLTAHSAVLSNTRVLSPSLVNTARASFFRYQFLFDFRLNRTAPADLGFGYESASTLGQGPPYFNVAGYSPIGGAQSGPRTSAQNTYEFADSLSWFRGAHSFKVGGSYRRVQINVFQATVPNGLFIFTPAAPANDAFANLLLGAPQIFFQGLGDFYRGLRNRGGSLFAQDEWRVNRKLTFNYGMRWEAINPNSEIRNRLNAFVPGVQSQVMPSAPTGILFPGDPGVSDGIAANFYKGFMPRVGLAYDPTGAGLWAIRAGYGIFYDPFSNGANVAATFAVSAVPWVQFNQKSGNVNFQNPYAGGPAPVANTFASPTTMLGMDPTARPPYAQDWNLSVQRALHKDYVLEVRYVGTKGTRLPRTVERNPSVYAPGATSGNADRRRINADCPSDGGPCRLATAATLIYGLNSSYNAAQVSLSHRYAAGFAFNLSYWYSKSIDYLSGMNLNLTSAQALAGENDMAQNPFNLAAERGLSLFDARHRFVASGLWELPFGLQLNGIMTTNAGTPFTVYDTANVALQATSPPISGYAASRPDLIGDPNSGPRTVETWLSRAPFRRLSAATEAGNFGNAGRNIARGPGLINVDISLLKNFRIHESVRLQFRAEAFNVANHANFGLPIADLASPNFGRILSAGQARLVQFGLKVIF